MSIPLPGLDALLVIGALLAWVLGVSVVMYVVTSLLERRAAARGKTVHLMPAVAIAALPALAVVLVGIGGLFSDEYFLRAAAAWAWPTAAVALLVSIGWLARALANAPKGEIPQAADE